MRTVFVLFDSLNRHALSTYGGVLPTPNFDRLADRAVVFDNHYVGSLPCMPARRDLQSGRLNFLHRSWGPLEPFDDNFPGLMKDAGIYSHLVSDHYHYFEDGGATYHTRYNTWDFIRGQESDPWVAMVKPALERFREQYHPIQFEETRDGHRLQGMINRSLFEPKELEAAQLHQGFAFTKGVPLLKIPALPDAKRSPRQGGFADTKTVLFDLAKDPHQLNPIQAPEIEQEICAAIIREMLAHDAPEELYQRFDLQTEL